MQTEGLSSAEFNHWLDPSILSDYFIDSGKGLSINTKLKQLIENSLNGNSPASKDLTIMHGGAVLDWRIQESLNNSKKRIEDLKRQNTSLLEKSRILESKYESYELLIKNTDQGFILLDTDFQILNHNSQAAALLQGIGDEELAIGKNVLTCFPRRYLTEFQEMLEQVREKGQKICDKALSLKGNPNKYYNLCLHAVEGTEKTLKGFCLRIKDESREQEAILALAAKNNLITSIFNSTDSGICVTDANGILTQANEAYFKIYGYEKEELLNKPFEIVVQPEQKEFARKLHDAFIAGQPEQPMEWEVVKKDGSLIDIYVTTQLYVNADGARFKVTTITDISEQKKNRDRIKEAYTHMEAILESSGDPIWCIDKDLNLLHFNEAFRYRMEIEDAKASKGESVLFHSFPKYFLESWRGLYQKALSGNSFIHTLNWSNEKYGNRDFEFRFNPFKNEKGEIIGATVFGRDVTAEKETERKIVASEEKFRKLSESAPIGIFQADHSGLITYANQRLMDILGTKEQNLVGKELKEFIHPTSKDQIENNWLTKISIQNGKYKEIKVLSTNGDSKWLRVRTSIQSTSKDKQNTYVGNVEDITDSILAQSEVLRMFEVVPNGIAVAKHGMGIIKANPVMISWLGMSMEEILKIPELELINFFHPDDHQKLLNAFDQKITKNQSLLDLEMRLWKDYPQNEETRWISMNIIPDLENSLFYISSKDISRRKEEEEYLRMIESVVVNTKEAVVITSGKQKSNQEDLCLNIVYVNDTFSKMTGYTREEVLGKAPDLLAGPGSESPQESLIEKAILNWEHLEIETIRFKKDGTPFWVDVSIFPVKNDKGELTHMVSILRDITERKEIEEEIVRSQANLSALINNTQDLIMSVGIDGRLITVNKACENLIKTRLNLDPQPGTIALKYVPKHRRDFWNEAFMKAKSGEIFSVIHKDVFEEKIRYYSISVTPILSGKEILGCTIFSRDITTQQRDKEALFRTNQLLENILENAPVAIFAKDKMGRITNVNPIMESFLGRTEPEILGKTVFDLLPKDRAQILFDRENEILHSRSPQIHRDAIRKNGRNVYQQNITFPIFGLDDEVMGIAGIVLDITDFEETKIQLQELNERFKMAVNAGNIGVWEYDFINGKLFWDENMFKLFKVNPAKFRNNYLDWAETLFEEDREATEKYLSHCLENDQPFDTVFRIVWPENEIRYMVGAGTLYKNEKGLPQKMIGINMDITDERKAQDRIRLARDLAEEMTRLKSNFLANMSHEIRTPLNGIMGLLPMLKIEKDANTLDEIINMMEKSGKRLLNTLIGILELARIEAEQTDYTLVKVNLSNLVDEVFQSLGSMAHAKKLGYRYESPNQDYYVLADERMLTQIFTNMVGNALKFTQSGEVSITINLRQKENKSFVVVAIEDTGIGISEENLKNIFEPFKQESEGIKRRYEGSGLGLSIVKRYSELLEGSIEVESQKGQGSKFSVLLPQYKEDIHLFKPI
ncbi:MAG: PAS domain S-box protein [Bacteroidia bacterium]|nr:PAS domain S-box protein [Bacteroidia bacterium]